MVSWDKRILQWDPLFKEGLVGGVLDNSINILGFCEFCQNITGYTSLDEKSQRKVFYQVKIIFIPKS